MNKPLKRLNNLTPSQFLRDYWQKKPLLIKNAIDDFENLLTPNELAGLACEEDVQSRIVNNTNNSWQVADGPFAEDDFAKLPKQNWTLLVQSVNHHLPEAAELLTLFNFIPHVRLDDLMVSYAPTGGSVGAHVDSYDVFLLQGSGKRRWQISAQTDLSLIEDAPIKLLKHFKAEQEWVLETGDMLYLPPNYAHHGVAETNDCMTYSIGFRAPAAQELTHSFLNYLQDTIQAKGYYEDKALSLQTHPAEISDAMIKKVEKILRTITWDKGHINHFLGIYMTEPKPDIVFEPPQKISPIDFAKKLAKKPLRLDLKSLMLFQQNNFYLNGETLAVPTRLTEHMRHLADHRFLKSVSLNEDKQQALANTLYAAYTAGYINFE